MKIVHRLHRLTQIIKNIKKVSATDEHGLTRTIIPPFPQHPITPISKICVNLCNLWTKKNKTNSWTFFS